MRRWSVPVEGEACSGGGVGGGSAYTDDKEEEGCCTATALTGTLSCFISSSAASRGEDSAALTSTSAFLPLLMTNGQRDDAVRDRSVKSDVPGECVTRPRCTTVTRSQHRSHDGVWTGFARE